MPYTLLHRSETDVPAVLTLFTPQGEDVQIGVRVISAAYDDACNHDARTLFWYTITNMDGQSRTRRGRPEALSGACGASLPGEDGHPVVLSAEQVRLLEAEEHRVLEDTPEGRAVGTLNRERAERLAQMDAEQTALRRSRGVRTLEVAPAYGASLQWAVALSAAEAQARGLNTGRVLLGVGGEYLPLEHLHPSNPVLRRVWDASPVIGAFLGCTNTAVQVTETDWNDLVNEQVRVIQDTQEDRDRDRQQEAARLAGLQDEARRSGQPQITDAWFADDATDPDSSASLFTRRVHPDGHQDVLRTPSF